MLKFSFIRDKVQDYQPKRALIDKLIRKSLQHKYAQVMLSISIVDSQTSQQLNLEYRQQNKPTNVISLEYAASREQFNFLSGELILCDDVIVKEANEQNKTIQAHYAHMIVHGLLHLQGYDHQDDQEAIQMENLERQILNNFAINNPYQ
ncbi:MAG: rRNA maturation RNase YbeY [Pseudomonadota bacterium]|jgi:probable rRNA maturation factor